jgi:hypothetical protein
MLKRVVMKRVLSLSALIIIIFSACNRYSDYEGVAFVEKEPRDWENPGVFGINKEDPHATIISFDDEVSALKADKTTSPQITCRLTVHGSLNCQYPPTRDPSGSSRMISIPATGPR